MAQTRPPAPESENDSSEVRGKLIHRLAMAGLLVAALLGVLVLFDYLATPPEEPEIQIFTRPVPVAPKKEVTQPVTPASNLPDPPTSDALAPVPVPVPASASETPLAPKVDLPPPPVVAVSPEAPTVKPAERNHNRSATEPAPVIIKRPASTGAPVNTRLPHEVLEVPEGTESPSVVLPPVVPKISIRPTVRVLDTKPMPVVPPMPQRLFSGFLVQAGVFSSAQRAEELHAKLTLGGVASTLETRVQVGPFRTRQEAEAAQVKLKELGVESVLVPPKNAR